MERDRVPSFSHATCCMMLRRQWNARVVTSDHCSTHTGSVFAARAEASAVISANASFASFFVTPRQCISLESSPHPRPRLHLQQKEGPYPCPHLFFKQFFKLLNKQGPGPFLGCHCMPWHALACHGMPWHAVACHGMAWRAIRMTGHAIACERKALVTAWLNKCLKNN